jgi:uncharacterized damage-inducible protein DinB
LLVTPVLGPTEARLIPDLAAFPTLRLEHVLTRRIIAAIPPEHGEYRPQAGARSTAELARHIVGAELRFLGGTANGTFADVRNVVDTARDLTSLVSVYETEFAATLETLATVTGDELVRVLDYRGVVQMPALGFVQLALNHAIHHPRAAVRALAVGRRERATDLWMNSGNEYWAQAACNL